MVMSTHQSADNNKGGGCYVTYVRKKSGLLTQSIATHRTVTNHGPQNSVECSWYQLTTVPPKPQLLVHMRSLFAQNSPTTHDMTVSLLGTSFLITGATPTIWIHEARRGRASALTDKQAFSFTQPAFCRLLSDQLMCVYVCAGWYFCGVPNRNIFLSNLFLEAEQMVGPHLRRSGGHSKTPRALEWTNPFSRVRGIPTASVSIR